MIAPVVAAAVVVLLLNRPTRAIMRHVTLRPKNSTMRCTIQTHYELSPQTTSQTWNNFFFLSSDCFSFFQRALHERWRKLRGIVGLQKKGKPKYNHADNQATKRTTWRQSGETRCLFLYSLQAHSKCNQTCNWRFGDNDSSHVLFPSSTVNNMQDQAIKRAHIYVPDGRIQACTDLLVLLFHRLQYISIYIYLYVAYMYKHTHTCIYT